jgi:L-fucose mutarotase|nr:RbsD/FucU domain-containing protein [Pseudarthrobacter sp. efr-133-R2A-89]
MIKYTLTHPRLMAGLAKSGNGSQILVADANYPHNTGAPATARRVAPSLRPITTYQRFESYDAARSSNTAVVIADGETRHYANLLLTIGVRLDGTA